MTISIIVHITTSTEVEVRFNPQSVSLWVGVSQDIETINKQTTDYRTSKSYQLIITHLVTYRECDSQSLTDSSRWLTESSDLLCL